MSSQRPGQLTAIAIVGIVLGILGTCGGLWGVAGALLQGPMQEAMREQQEKMFAGSGIPAEQLESQRGFQQQIEELNAKWVPFTATHQTLNLIASAILLAAAIMLLRTSARAPTVFVIAVAANVFVDLVGTILGIIVQQDMQEAMQGMMADMAAQQPGAPGADRMFEGIMQASSWLGICFGGAWLLVKIGYYVWGLVYLRKPEVKQLFGGTDQPAQWREAP